ncbi:tetratricopeptide repeat protein [Photobacterium rosenbergii]|uniref:Tetratricopeptide repeat protein n=1 Tax=Photobacterium rosenbergii TaxID=294936 RepID=A0ABU3ZDK1_9GAMM|nr:tetratricopeptide repeat protein [Photobacterium rosenbergii]MDV5168184.1 tetratricopeptide repeat protein [Photobacterium rosenbergii]
MSHNTILTALFLVIPATSLADEPVSLQTIQHQWAKCQYDTFNYDNKISCLQNNISLNQQALAKQPDRTDLKVWLAINKSTLAGADGGLSALSLVKESKILLEDVIQNDPKVLDGSAFTSLGSLYYQVPGWPISFGDDDQAEALLKQALAINPNGIDPNYFYGDFLARNGRKSEAITFLKKAQHAAPRPGRPLADKGRQQEIATKLKELQ